MSKRLNSTVLEQLDNVAEWLIDIMPHGSGVDCKWNYVVCKNGTIKLSNAYHCMNENGYYCGYADFTVSFKYNSQLSDFKLEFNGKHSNALNHKHFLRDYLDDVIMYSIMELSQHSCNCDLYVLSLKLNKE